MSLRAVALAGLMTLALLLAPVAVLADEGHDDHGMAMESGPTGRGTATTKLQLHAPGKTVAGNKIEVKATLTDERGAPIEKAQVFFSSPAQFGGISGEIEIDEAITDDQGVATIGFDPRRTGDITLIARFQGDPIYAPSEVKGALRVEAGPQAYVETAGVKVPFLGVWVVVLVLTAVWGLYMTVMSFVLRIAKAT